MVHHGITRSLDRLTEDLDKKKFKLSLQLTLRIRIISKSIYRLTGTNILDCYMSALVCFCTKVCSASYCALEMAIFGLTVAT